MIWSRYNYLFRNDDGKPLAYNSFSNTFLELDEKSFKQAQSFKKDPGSVDLSQNPVLFIQMCQGKFLIEEDDDPIAELKLGMLSTHFSSRNVGLTIAPTRDCNFNCSYCFEDDRAPIYMDDETEDALMEFVEAYKNASSVSVTWFGGEPLMAFDRILSISERMRSSKIPFFASMVTNGYLLTKDKIEQLKRCRVRDIQVTIDGDAEHHNKHRPHKEHGDTWHVLMENLRNTLEGWEGSLTIRVNVGRDNVHDYPRYRRILLDQLKSDRVGVYPGLITDYRSGGCNSAKSCMLSRDEVAEFYLKAYREHKIDDLRFFPDLGNFSCVAKHMNSFLVGPEGELYKCWNCIGMEDEIVGNVRTPGRVNKKKLAKYMCGTDCFDDPKCRNCFYLPRCYGGCPYMRYMNKYNGAEFDSCSRIKGKLKDFLITHYKIRNSSNKKEAAEEAIC